MIIIDTQEKDIKHIIDYFDKNNIIYKRQKLNFADYTNEAGSLYIERKRIGELAGNFTGTDKLRFQREFKRSMGYKVIVMIEGSVADLESHAYRSRLSVKDYIGRIRTWGNHYMLKFEFIGKEQAGQFILERLG